ncbi:hypothetical protein E5P2_00059 (plasmid) [Variovorax sp. PBL-E5]|nr:hypothetical protein E5P2_00059 [Variovorax sp. PBL-E5]
MNTHKHARLTFARRIEMVKQMTLEGLDAVQAAAAHGVTAPTAQPLDASHLDVSNHPSRGEEQADLIYQNVLRSVADNDPR